jgi:hypothetical protein
VRIHQDKRGYFLLLAVTPTPRAAFSLSNPTDAPVTVKLRANPFFDL